MIPPQDLQNKKFSHTVRGYNPIEVDDYVKFLLTRYAQLYAENADLEKRLHIVSGKYEELAGDEETIRNAVAQAKKLSQAMIENAQKTSEKLANEVQARCDQILADAQSKLDAEKKELAELRAEAAKFRKLLLDEYSRHLSLMKQSSVYLPNDPDEVAFPDQTRLRETVLSDLDPDQALDDAIIAPSRDPELDEFKRFVHPAASGNDPKKDRLNQEIYKVSVDVEEPADDVSVSAPKEESRLDDSLSASDEKEPELF